MDTCLYSCPSIQYRSVGRKRAYIRSNNQVLSIRSIISCEICVLVGKKKGNTQNAQYMFKYYPETCYVEIILV